MIITVTWNPEQTLVLEGTYDLLTAPRTWWQESRLSQGKDEVAMWRLYQVYRSITIPELSDGVGRLGNISKEFQPIPMDFLG